MIDMVPVFNERLKSDFQSQGIPQILDTLDALKNLVRANEARKAQEAEQGKPKEQRLHMDVEEEEEIDEDDYNSYDEADSFIEDEDDELSSEKPRTKKAKRGKGRLPALDDLSGMEMPLVPGSKVPDANPLHLLLEVRVVGDSRSCWSSSVR
jgi:hypothetical protein